MARRINNAVDVQVGQRMRARRLMLDMSQEKLGKAVGLTFQQIQKYEKGTNRIGASRMVQIAEALETTPSYFFEGVEAPQAGRAVKTRASGDALETTEVNAFISSRYGIALVRAFSKLKSEKTRLAFVQFIVAMTG